MRITDLGELGKPFADHHINSQVIGTLIHVRLGLGVERKSRWILSVGHVRDTCLYPRLSNRCLP